MQALLSAVLCCLVPFSCWVEGPSNGIGKSPEGLFFVAAHLVREKSDPLLAKRVHILEATTNKDGFFPASNSDQIGFAKVERHIKFIGLSSIENGIGIENHHFWINAEANVFGRPNFNLYPCLHGIGRRLTAIPENYVNIPFLARLGNRHKTLRQPNIRSQLHLRVGLLQVDSANSVLVGFNSSVGRLAVQADGVEKCDGAECGQKQLEFTQPNDFFGRIGHALLRGKIFYFTLAGFLLLPFVSFGLFWVFEDADRNRKLFGGLIAFSVLPLAFGLILFGLFA